PVAVSKAANDELMQVVIPPAKSRLDHLMELPEVPRPRNEQAAPDRRVNIGKCDKELHRIRFLEQHESSMDRRRSVRPPCAAADVPQLHGVLLNSSDSICYASFRLGRRDSFGSALGARIGRLSSSARGQGMTQAVDSIGFSGEVTAP